MAQHNDPLSGARYPDDNEPPSIAQFVQNAVNDLSKVGGGIFTTAAARNTAFSNWVAAGNTMIDGLTSRVAGREQVFRSGSWHGVSSSVFTTTTVTDTAVHTARQSMMTLSVPDPGFPYQIQASGTLILAVIGTGVTVAAQIAVNGSLINPQGPNVTAGSGLLASTWVPAVTDPLTGAATVTLDIIVVVPNAGFGYQAAASDPHNRLSALVVPA